MIMGKFFFFMSSRDKPAVSWSLLSCLPTGTVFTRASTGTRTNASGMIEALTNNEPRFDYDPVTHEPRGLLMEEQRTNSVFPSVIDAAGTGWTLTRVTAGNAIAAPDGSLSMRQIIETTDSFLHGAYSNSVSITAGEDNTVSFYAKAGTETVVQVAFNATVFTTNPYANFDLVNGVLGTVSGCSATITHVGSGVYRCTVTATPTVSTTGNAIIVLFANNNPASPRVPSYTGTGKYFYLWGCQREVASFASSYIPTTDAAATRAVENLTTTDMPWLNATQGTMLVEVDAAGPTNVTTSSYTAGFDNGGISNAIILYHSSSFIPLGAVLLSGVVKASASGSTLPKNTPFKQALSYVSGGSKTACRGVLLGDGALLYTAIPTGLARLSLGNRYDGARPMTGHLRGFKYWNRALSNAELQRITT